MFLAIPSAKIVPQIMAQNKYVPKRKLEPNLFPSDQSESDEPSNEVLPEKFITPELTEKQRDAQGQKFSEDYDKALSWGKFVCDAKILKSDNRKQLKQYLDDLLEGLWQRYETTSTCFPSTAELDRLTAVVTKLAKLIGIKKYDFGDLISAMKRIENRWGKTRLIGFADNLMKRLLEAPMSPVSVVHQAWLKCPDTGKNVRQTLREAELILTGEVSRDAKEFPWEVVFAVIKKLNFANTKLDQAEPLLDELVEVKQRRWVCYMMLMDLRRQQLEWEQKYADEIAPSIKWIYLLQRPDDFEKLTQVYFGDALKPDKVKVELDKQGNRDRRNKSYHKTRNDPVPQLRKQVKSRKRLKSSKK